MHKTLSERPGVGGTSPNVLYGSSACDKINGPNWICKNEGSIRSKTNENGASIGSKIETKIDTKWKNLCKIHKNLFNLDQLHIHVSLELNVIDTN